MKFGGARFNGIDRRGFLKTFALAMVSGPIVGISNERNHDLMLGDVEEIARTLGDFPIMDANTILACKTTFALNEWLRYTMVAYDLMPSKMAATAGVNKSDVSDWISPNPKKRVPLPRATNLARRYAPQDIGLVQNLGRLDDAGADMIRCARDLARLGRSKRDGARGRSNQQLRYEHLEGTLADELGLYAKSRVKYWIQYSPNPDHPFNVIEIWRRHLDGAETACRIVAAALRENDTYPLVSSNNICDMVRCDVEVFVRYLLDRTQKNVSTRDILFRKSLSELQADLRCSLNQSMKSIRGSNTSAGIWTEVEISFLMALSNEPSSNECLEQIWNSQNVSKDGLRNAMHNLDSLFLRNCGVRNTRVSDEDLAKAHLLFDGMYYGNNHVDHRLDVTSPVLDRMLLDMIVHKSSTVRDQEFLALRYATNLDGERIFTEISRPKLEQVSQNKDEDKDRREWASRVLRSMDHGATERSIDRKELVVNGSGRILSSALLALPVPKSKS
jgi:hypothetical protein